MSNVFLNCWPVPPYSYRPSLEGLLGNNICLPMLFKEIKLNFPEVNSINTENLRQNSLESFFNQICQNIPHHSVTQMELENNFKFYAATKWFTIISQNLNYWPNKNITIGQCKKITFDLNNYTDLNFNTCKYVNYVNIGIRLLKSSFTVIANNEIILKFKLMVNIFIYCFNNFINF